MEDPGRRGGMVSVTLVNMKRDRGFQKVGDLLGDVLDTAGLRDSVRRAEVVEEWDDRVGEAIANVTRAKGVREATLIVEVRSSSWLMELNLMKEEILRQVNEGRREALIKKIVFVLAEDSTR